MAVSKNARLVQGKAAPNQGVANGQLAGNITGCDTILFAQAKDASVVKREALIFLGVRGELVLTTHATGPFQVQQPVLLVHLAGFVNQAVFHGS